MRGSIVKRSRWSWALVVDQGRDPVTKKRKQKWVKFTPAHDQNQREATKAAETELARLLHQLDAGTFVDAAKTTLVEYLCDWHGKVVAPLKRASTARVYLSLIERHIGKAPVGAIPLQKVRPSDLEAFYRSVKLSPSSIGVLHAVIHRALRTAVRDKLLVANPATAVEDRPRSGKDVGQIARAHCWSADEARRVLAAAHDDPQLSAFVALALDSGGRKSELLGLAWDHVDLDAATITIARQLVSGGDKPTFGPTKTGRSRVVSLTSETVTRLRAHRKHQRVLLMANRTSYQDHGLVFAMEPADLQTPTAKLGQPCPALVDRCFRKLIKAAGVKPIKFHGCRHTSATLLLGAGVPVQVVAQRLGHASVTMTLNVYAHALPDMQKDAAAKLGAVLAG